MLIRRKVKRQDLTPIFFDLLATGVEQFSFIAKVFIYSPLALMWPCPEQKQNIRTALIHIIYGVLNKNQPYYPVCAVKDA